MEVIWHMVPDPQDLRGVVIVTGAAGGIGSAVADRLTGEGYGLVLVDRVACKRSERELAVTLMGDVRSAGLVDEAVSAAEQMGELYGLVNIAAIREYRPFLEVDSDLVELHFEINLLAAAKWMVAFAKRLVDNETPGAIVSVKSIMAHRVVPANAAYAASKSALRSLSNSAAIDLSPFGIRVNCVAPGPTRTPMLAGLLADQETERNLQQRIPLGRIAEPHEIAGAIAFLLSQDSSYVTGSTITVDGGYLLV